ncbi:unnamed protein product, partial [Brassica napus]
MPRPETDLRHMCYRLDREELHRKDYAGTSSALKTISSPRATTPFTDLLHSTPRSELDQISTENPRGSDD